MPCQRVASYSVMASLRSSSRARYDELFMNDQERAENRLPKIYDIPLSEIDDFPNHPFQVRLDEDMDQLVESVKERGIITPITLRKKNDGRYEIVSGRRRKKACELAGLETIPAEIKDLTRDEAIILMVESNLQRSVILPSEKAFSYKMRLEAMKSIMCEEKPNQREKINIRYADARRYIPSSVPYDKTGEFILKALEYYHRHLERMREDAR